MSKYDSRTAEKVVIRMPEGLRGKIKAVAAENRRSMNNLIVRMLEAQLEPSPTQQEDTWIPQIGQLVKLRDEFKVTYNVEMGVIVGFIRVKGVFCAKIEVEGSSEITFEDLNKICPVYISL